jgi:hypothetical protein
MLSLSRANTGYGGLINNVDNSIGSNMSEENLNTHRLIFCINSGRSGSQYLSDLFGSALEITSFHEPKPKMNRQYLQMINQKPYDASFQMRAVKIEAIKNMLNVLPPGRIYCETNHMFIKTFFDVVIEELKNIEIIILRREIALVLKSFIEMRYFSPENKVWPKWMSSPNARTAALACIGNDETLDQYDLCIAYLFDIEARAQRFRKDYPWVKTHEIRLESMNDYRNVERLFADLSITPTQTTKEICGKKINERIKAKKKFNNSSKLEYCRERIAMYIRKAESMGILLPGTLALDSYNY